MKKSKFVVDIDDGEYIIGSGGAKIRDDDNDDEN